MKKIAAILFLVTSISYAQNDSINKDYEKYNELKLNGVMLLIGAFEASYERNLAEDSSVGVSFFIPYDQENLDADLNYYVSPYYRMFFGKKYAAGFFVEGFGMLNSIDREMTHFDDNGNFIIREKNVTDFAVGFGLGGKWVTKRGFVFELNAGIGRNLFNNDESDYLIVGKFGFNLGYRF